MDKHMTPRLLAVAAAVEKSSAVCDVGTDHAYIPIFLVQQNIIHSAVAADISRGPLLRAEKNIRRFGLEDKIKTVLSDGLDSVDMSGVDTVIIAGMGGLTIADIIKRAPKRGVKYILQPMTSGEELKRFLLENGFALTAESLAAEGRKIYNIISASDGSQGYTEADLYLNKLLSNDPLFPRYREMLRKKWETIVKERKKSTNSDTEYYERLLRETR